VRTGTLGAVDADGLRAWFAARIPGDWYVGPPDVVVDRDEILVVGDLLTDGPVDDAGRADRDAAQAACVRAHRETTRAARMAIAAEVEDVAGRRVAWGARCGDRTEVFTSVSVPVMTRLRMPERRVLDTLIDAGVARSRSEALAWCVRLVGRHEREWIDELRAAITELERVRATGPPGI
jgi:hypothetical protein